MSPTKKESMPEEFKLRREVGFWGVVGFTVGQVIGSGIFISPKPVVLGAHSLGLTLIIWVVCGLIALCDAFVKMEICLLLRKTQEEYILFLVTVGGELAFIRMCTSLFFTSPAINAAQGVSIASYLTSIFFGDQCNNAPYDIRLLLAVTIVLFIYAINIYSVRFAVQTQVIFTCIKSLAVLMICVGGIVRLAQGYTKNFDDAFADTTTNPGDIALAVIGGSWAYGGYGIQFYEEVKNPNRNIPLGTITSMVFVTVVYLFCNISYFTVMTPQQLLDSPAVATTWAEAVIPQFSWIMPLFVSMSIFGAANGGAFISGRETYVPAKHGHLPKLLSMIHTRNYTPSPALIFRSLFVLLYIAVGDNVSNLIAWIGIANGIFDFIGIVLFFYLRWSPKWRDEPRPIKAPLVCPIITLVMTTFVVLSPFIYNPQWGYFAGIIIAAIAMLVYVPFVRWGWVPPGVDALTRVAQLYLEVAPEKAPMDDEGVGPKVLADLSKQRQNDTGAGKRVNISSTRM